MATAAGVTRRRLKGIALTRSSFSRESLGAGSRIAGAKKSLLVSAPRVAGAAGDDDVVD
jgi:hypothetical protein